MAKTTIRMQVRSQEVWGRDGQVTESINLGMPNGDSEPMMGYEPQHSASLFFPSGEGFKNFPMGGDVDVTFEPVKAAS